MAGPKPLTWRCMEKAVDYIIVLSVGIWHNLSCACMQMVNVGRASSHAECVQIALEGIIEVVSSSRTCIPSKQPPPTFVFLKCGLGGDYTRKK